MTLRPTISVIITNYNYEEYVGHAIESVLSQTRLPDEIIVIDDGSTDSSPDIIRSYGDRVRAVLQSNEGIRSVTSTGYAISTGQIVMYLDADDLLYPAAVERVEKAFGPGIAKVQFDLDVIDGNGRRLGRRMPDFSGGGLSETELAREFSQTGTYRWPVTSGNAYSRNFLSQVMPVDPPVSLDGVLNTISPLYGGIITISDPQGQYRVHQRNNSRKNTGGTIAFIPNFASRIGYRKQEFNVLREHAARLGRVLPNGDFLDNELVFVNYRIMARKLSLEDGGDHNRSLLDLWIKGMIAIGRGHFRPGATLKHAIWICSVTLLPAPLAQRLIAIRFLRTHWFSNLRSLLVRSTRL
ncbi:glycosyltransferase family 2 protein [Bradyrhizobium yuanmingense]|uniref:glycosyltransferase family 2 protein n=1 Tax=Bradyrhizobium yuanmingense TaxID=108015 RepID=UPI0023B8F63F|nr:glycosyltransferase family A protein [Bradyrhizobium yuanmingense]MDF0493078.1 glycosyltransferase family A protein [Bradyrhizobium yuanmingense]